MKIKWFVANVPAVGPPDKAEHAILGVVLAGPLLSIQAIFVVEEPLCNVGTIS